MNSNININTNFEARVRLCDKSMLSVQHNQALLNKSCPIDFFYKETKTRTKIDLFFRDVKELIRKEQSKKNNSEFKNSALKKLFSGANQLLFFINKVSILRNIKELYQTVKILKRIDRSSPEYIDTWATLGNSTPNKFVDINFEDKRIEEISKLDDSTIFLMNHDNPNRDKFIYPILNSFINYAYATEGKQAECPRPYIIVSKNVFKSAANNSMRRAFGKMGLVAVDASMTDRNHLQNVSPVKGLINKFSENKANLFIFPEGNNSVYKDKTLREKFQLEVTKIIKKIFENKPCINIVPIGISYNDEQNSMGSIYIGEILKLALKDKNCNLISSNQTTELGEISKRKTLISMADSLATSIDDCVEKSKHISTNIHK